MGKLLSYFIMPHPPIILPEVGKGQEAKISETSAACLKVAEEVEKLKPDTIILITPHGPMFKDAVALSYTSTLEGNLSNFGADTLYFKNNINLHLTDKIIEEAESSQIQTIKIDSKSSTAYGITNELDHGAMVPLYFINKKYSDYSLVHITYGLLPKLDLFQFGINLKNAIENSCFNAVLIASGDLSHKLTKDGPYGFNPNGKIFDEKILHLLENVDVESIFNLDKQVIESAGECGLRSFYIMLGAMEDINVKANLLSYEGPFGVGYGVLKFLTEPGKGKSYLKTLSNLTKENLFNKRKNEDPYVSLARKSLEYFINTGKYIEIPQGLSDEMINSKRGAFVSLHKDDALRGCIGTIFPTTECIAKEIIRNAVEASQHDPRFLPVKASELASLEISVDILMPPQQCSYEELDCKKYGVIVRSQGRTGLLLPNLEGVNTVDDQLEIALRKAGISKSEKYSIERFEVIRHT